MSLSQDASLRSLFTAAKVQRTNLESLPSPNDTAYQKTVQSAIGCLERCRELANRGSLFSPNEILDDIASNDLQYLLIDFYLGDLILKDNTPERKGALQRTQEAFERYLHLLESYRLFSKSNRKLYDRYMEDHDGFSLAESNNASTRRDAKIKRFREEKELKAKLMHLAQTPSALDHDESILRELHLAEIELDTHVTFQTLDMIAQERKILAMTPPAPSPVTERREADNRERNGWREDQYSDRLDPSILKTCRNGKAGPILSKEGKPLQPFMLLDSRQRLQNGVFKPDHALPTMTIDEYLEEEQKRGGIISEDGKQTGRFVEVDEDNVARADAETLKAREWDEFAEANPKGSGNTMNRG